MTKTGKISLSVSFSLHCLLLLLLLLLKAPDLPPLRQQRVEIEFTEPQQAQDLETAAVPITKLPLDSSGETGTLGQPGAVFADKPLPSNQSRTTRSTNAVIEIPDVPVSVENPLTGRPAAADILAQVFGGGEQSDAAIQSPGIMPAGALEWESRERKILRTEKLTFPEILRREGREVEVEAVITVAPSGRVIRTEITRSSGYTQVDHAVESVLRQYLFEPTDDEQLDYGKIRFFFRLERSR